MMKMALYMLYRSKAKPEYSNKREVIDDLRARFEDIYKEHQIDILGFWENADDPTEIYYISKYEDEADYKAKVDKLRSDERYTKLTAKLNEARMETKATRLNPMWVPE